MTSVEVISTTTSNWSVINNGNEFTFSCSATASGTGDINATDAVVEKANRQSQIENFALGHGILAKADVQQTPNFNYNTSNIYSISDTTFVTKIIN
jgi:hypothetical protein